MRMATRLRRWTLSDLPRLDLNAVQLEYDWSGHVVGTEDPRRVFPVARRAFYRLAAAARDWLPRDNDG